MCWTILIEPKDETAAQRSYVISGTVNRTELAEMRGDELRTMGLFESVTHAMQTLVPRL